jgi:hypothetical protein
VAYGEVEGPWAAVLGEHDGRTGAAPPQDPPPEVVRGLGWYVLDPHGTGTA